MRSVGSAPTGTTGGGTNDAYDFCYLFKYRLDLPPGASTLTLPNAPNIRIFAMSLTTNTTPETAIAGGRLGQNLLPWANAGPDQTLNAATTNGTGHGHSRRQRFG